MHELFASSKRHSGTLMAANFIMRLKPQASIDQSDRFGSRDNPAACVPSERRERPSKRALSAARMTPDQASNE